MEKNLNQCAMESAPSSCPVKDPLAREDMVELDPQQEMVNHSAARIIQRTWRRHVDTRVFQYFKNLVRFRSRGDPRLLLRRENPNEADILDAAAGVHIRFRLGGTSFPPSIYYKIYTHRPIVDMCANSPMDYTHPGQKRPIPRQTHNQRSLAQDDRVGWYHRVENNGWRLLSGKSTLLGDIITLETNGKKVEFHHSKLQRRQDVERRRKRRKIEWMKHMYDRGGLIARTEHSETAVLVEQSVQGMMDAVEKLGPDLILEWEVDELLEWTNALNFDEYIYEWRSVGTSNSSESCKVKSLTPSMLEPCGTFSGLDPEDSQVGTNRSITHPLVSSLIQSEHSKANLSD
ncbi:protein MFI isoform X2 [Esox lucius]|nr:protein MFI isoform X2 [Esox lucius]